MHTHTHTHRHFIATFFNDHPILYIVGRRFVRIEL